MMEPLTLKRILGEIDAWCKQPQAAEPLAYAVEQLVAKVDQAADGVRLDLNSNSLDEEFRQLLEGSLLDYQDIDDCLREIVSGIRQSDRSLVEQQQLCLSEAMASLHQSTEAIEEWLTSPFMRCPKCGSKAENPDWICPDCNLEYLYPDLAPDGVAHRQVLNLGPEYVAVYKTYLGVLAGDVPLADLQQPLQALQDFLSGSLGMAKVNQDAQLRGLLKHIEGLCLRSLEGIDQMQKCFSTRETSDLRDGWLTLFTTADELQNAMPSLLTGLGIAPEHSLQTGQDSVEFSE